MFEQGWFGLVLMMILIIYTLKELGKGAWSGNAQQLIMLSSLSGFLVIGVTDSLFDAPRLTLLFWMLVFFSLVYTYATRESTVRKDLRYRLFKEVIITVNNEKYAWYMVRQMVSMTSQEITEVPVTR